MQDWKGIARALLFLALAGASAAQDAPPAPEASDPLAPLNSQPLLRDINFTLVAAGGPVLLAMNPLFPDDPQHVEHLKAAWGDYVRELAELFRADYAEPADLAPREGREQLLVVTLLRPDTFAGLREALQVHDAYDDQAFFARQIPAVVVLDPGTAVGVPGLLAGSRAVCHAAVHALLEACLPPDRTLPLWLTEGLAERLSSNSGRLPARRDGLRVFDIEALAGVGANPSWGAPDRRPLVELVAVGTEAELVPAAAAYGVSARDELLDLGHRGSLFLGWLDEGKLGLLSQAERERAWSGRRLVQVVLAGTPCAEALAEVLGEGAPATLEGSFGAWMTEQLVEKKDVLPRPKPPETEEVAVPKEVTPGAASPVQLLIPTGDLVVDHARALHQAAEGDLRGAAEEFQALQVRKDFPSAELELVRTEQRLCEQLDELRRRWLEGRAGKTVDVRDGDALQRATIVGVAGEQLTVRVEGTEREMPLSAAPPGALAGQLLTAGKELTGPDDEARALAFLLSPDADWKDKTIARARKEFGPAALAVLEQRADFEARLAFGTVVAALDALGEADLPLDAQVGAERDAWLARARTVLRASSLPLVADRIPTLRALTRQVLEAKFNAEPVACMSLHARTGQLQDGRVRANWDFAAQDELKDWLPVTLTEEDLARLPPIREALPGPPGLAVEEQQLSLRGQGRWRCALPFMAPLTVTYEVSYKTPLQGEAAAAGFAKFVALRMCADPFGSYLENEWLGQLTAFDKTARVSEQVPATMDNAMLDTFYDIRLEHDGQQLHAFVDDMPVTSIDVAGRTHGFVELLHSIERPVALRHLAIEGTLDVPALGPARDAWVAEQLVAMERGN